MDVLIVTPDCNSSNNFLEEAIEVIRDLMKVFEVPNLSYV
jgi:hypothetical protein